MSWLSKPENRGTILLLAALALTFLVYWPGLWGSWLFDDYPNIVENPGVHISHLDIPSLVRAALSSPSSIFKRPMASLTFALNDLAGGMNPFGWKLVNLLIHLLNGALVFVLARLLLKQAAGSSRTTQGESPSAAQIRCGVVAACIAAAWMLLPINLTGVLYVVQRMESLANVFVLLGLIGYAAGRVRMLSSACTPVAPPAGNALSMPTSGQSNHRSYRTGLAQAAASLIVGTAIGVTAKETAVMLPLYAFLVEWIVFRFRIPDLPAGISANMDDAMTGNTRQGMDRGVMLLFIVLLALPLLVGLAWLLPKVLSPESWATRDFTLHTRLLSEARIVVDYIFWTLLALPHWLSFYHDNFHISSGLLHPWTTLASLVTLAGLVILVFALRRRQPLVALGIALFLGCHLLAGSIIPLELIYEHRNYFASFGLMLALVPLFAVPASARWALPRRGMLAFALLAWTVLTASTAYAWGDPLALAQELAARAPNSPRAQYELGRSYIMASRYDPYSPYTPLVYAPLERAAKLPDSSILPQQALIFFNARMHRPIKDAWWDSLIASLRRRTPGVQDESSLAALTQCARQGLCQLPKQRMQEAFEAAVSHPDTDARLWANYGDYAWNVLGDQDKGLHLTERAVTVDPNEPAYHITLARMYIVRGQWKQAGGQIGILQRLNIGGSLDGSIDNLQRRLSDARCAANPSCNDSPN